MNLNTPFKLYANCLPVKGKNRSSICDIQRHKIRLIPNDLYYIITMCQGKSINEIKSIYENKFDLIIEEYFDYLLENEFVFFTENIDFFPNLSLKWESPLKITNAIIDVNSNSNHDYKKIFNQLDTLLCQSLEMRFYDKIEVDVIDRIIKYIEENELIISSIEILLPYQNSKEIEKIKLLVQKHKRITFIKIFNANKNELIPPLRDNKGFIYISKKNIVNEFNCGIISKKMFVSNIKSYTESSNYNSCLNRKIAIDTNGNIKNCPSMQQSFGNIKDSTLEQALNQKDFKKYWNITKDQIDVCKDCEFRYVCTDCRAYLEKPSNIYSKPLKCGYNPYTNEWSEWSINPLNQKAIASYGMQELIKK